MRFYVTHDRAHGGAARGPALVATWAGGEAVVASLGDGPSPETEGSGPTEWRSGQIAPPPERAPRMSMSAAA
jgi:hypothetical protein